MNLDMYKALWEPIEINGVAIKNRISMSPMGTFAYDQDGTDSEQGLRYFEERAKGGIGLLHTGSAYINTRLAQGSPSIHVDNIHCIPKATVLVERAHRWGAKFFLQLSPGTGRNSKLDLGNPEPPVSASAVPAHFDHNVICRAMTRDEIKGAMNDFKVAAEFAKRAGFDGVQIHAHAGYLIDQFLSEVWNKRDDEYGGSFENRCRFALEAVDAIRSVVGPKYPITFRISLDHRFAGGRTLEESMKILDVLDKSGIDAFDVDAGSYDTEDYIFPSRYNGDACMAYVCKEARKHLSKPIINAGNHSMESAAQLLLSGDADMVQFGRQSIADPQFANKLKLGRREEIRPCIICNEECIGRIFGRRTQLSCTVNPAAGFEESMEVTKLEKPQKVVVIGAGPGGMEAARCAAERGCSVTLYDKGSELGGTFKVIATGDFKHRIRELIAWYELQIKKLGVKVVLNTEITGSEPELAEADAIFVATGSLPLIPPIPGMDDPKVIDVYDVHKNGLPEGKNVVICGGGLSACDTALEYAPEGRNITIVEMRSKIGADVMYINAISINRLLKQYGVTCLTDTRVVGVNDEGVQVETQDGIRVLPADVVVGAFGRKRNMGLADAVLHAYPTKTTIIGDCMEPAKAGNAIREGFYAAMSLQDF